MISSIKANSFDKNQQNLNSYALLHLLKSRGNEPRLGSNIRKSGKCKDHSMVGHAFRLTLNDLRRYPYRELVEQFFVILLINAKK